MNWEQRYNEQTQLAASVLAERDVLGALLEKAAPHIALDIALRREIDLALTNYRRSQRLHETAN